VLPNATVMMKPVETWPALVARCSQENAGTQRLSPLPLALRHGAALPTRTGSDRSSDMETAPDLKLSPSEKGTLQKIAEGEYHLREFDWVALQHLKKLALAEDRPSGVVITKEGRRVLRRLTLPG
jgi:hypothetical protein